MKKITDTIEIPADIKFVNGMSSLLFGFFLFLLVLSSFEYFIKNKIKNLDTITITGDVLHNDISSIHHHIASNISENFYDINLFNAKKIFETIPWISQAAVKRVYPNQIEVKLSEYKAKAMWGIREDMKLVDEKGVIFEVSDEDDMFDEMPRLIGPDGQAKFMLDMYKQLSIALNPLKIKLKTLELKARGSWIATLDGGAHLELGRGSAKDVIDRANKFSAGAELMLDKLNKKSTDILYVDLRHSDGYALRMQGVSTLNFTDGNASLKK
jgi:cell division protein FtsQ